jgi:hypothetical protein
MKFVTRRWLMTVSSTVFEARAKASRDIAGFARPHLRRARPQRRHRIDHAGQRPVVDHHRLGGIARLVERVGDDEGDGVAHMHDLAAGKHGIGRRLERDPWRQRRARHRAEIGDVVGHQHEPDAGESARLGDVLDPKLRMGMRRTQHDRGQRSCRRDIRHIASGAPQQGIVFLAGERLADSEFHRAAFFIWASWEGGGGAVYHGRITA